MIRYWIMLKAAGVPVSNAEILGMWFRRSLTPKLAMALVLAHKTDLDVPLTMLESHSLAGGDPAAVVGAAIAIDKTGHRPNILQLSALDLKGGVDLAEGARAFADAVARFPELGPDEFWMRLGGDEDVVAQVRDGRFRPYAQLEGWIVRVDSRPMTGADLLKLISAGKIPDTAQIQPPNEVGWISRDQAARRLSGPGKPRDT